MEFKIGDRVAIYYDVIGGGGYYSQAETIISETKLYWITDYGNRIAKSSRKPIKQKKIQRLKEKNGKLGNYAEIYFANGQLDVIDELLSYMGE